MKGFKFGQNDVVLCEVDLKEWKVSFSNIDDKYSLNLEKDKSYYPCVIMFYYDDTIQFLSKLD